MTKIEHMSIARLRALPGFRLELEFNNGDAGVRDFADILSETGPMLEPLRDQTFFDKAFLTYGVPTWPNGLQLDPTNLHMELVQQGRIVHAVAAE